MNKREFIRNITFSSLALSLSSWSDSNETAIQHSDGDDIWSRIRADYNLKTEYINLENGYYNIMPKAILDRQLRELNQLNIEGSFYMRKKMADDRLKVRTSLAEFLQLPVEEMIITRNTTESMDIVISGMDWKKGDEAIFANQEYGAMIDMLKQQSKRYGITNRSFDLTMHPDNDEQIVAQYENLITDKTRLILVSHMINITGHILPIRKICDMAHKHGVKVLVDGAHAIGHFVFNIKELNCDYYGSSLHKWLSTPLGCGMLYVKKDNISGLWPLFGESAYPDDDIRKLNHTGTGPIHAELCIPAAIDYYKSIGGRKKEERLRYLQNYWTEKVRHLPRIILNTPKDPSRSCAIANVGIENIRPIDLADTLFEKYKIWTVAIDGAGVKGCRITPNVYTSTEELDKFVVTLKEISGN